MRTLSRLHYHNKFYAIVGFIEKVKAGDAISSDNLDKTKVKQDNGCLVFI